MSKKIVSAFYNSFQVQSTSAVDRTRDAKSLSYALAILL